MKTHFLTTHLKSQIAVLILTLFALCPLNAAPRQSTLYNPDPEHLWNRLHAALCMRTAPDGTHHGEDSLDALLFTSTQGLVLGPRHEEAIHLLDQFNRQSAEEIAKMPHLHRALIQRPLWTVFDWSTEERFDAESDDVQALVEAKHNLQTRIANAIRMVALRKDEIAALPNSYEIALASKLYPLTPNKDDDFKPFNPTQPYLPAGLSSNSGGWTFPMESLTPAPVHFEHFVSRSAFLVAVRMPAGKEYTAETYFNALNDFRPGWVSTDQKSPSGPTLPNGGIHEGGVIPNPETPQFPDGTQWALVRKAMLISSEGEIVVSPIVESVQVRTYITVEKNGSNQAMTEFHLSTRAFLNEDKSPLEAKDGSKVAFTGFLIHKEYDPFEKDLDEWKKWLSERTAQPGLNCFGCHSGWGIHGVNTRSQLFSSRSVEPLTLFSRGITAVESSYVSAKMRRYEWGVFKGLTVVSDGRKGGQRGQ